MSFCIACVRSTASSDVLDLYEITGRKRTGSRWVFEKVLEFCRDRGIVVQSEEEFADSNPQDELNPVGELGLSYLIEQLGLSGERIASLESLEGGYLLFSFIQGGNIAVTWLQLQSPTLQFPLPIFSARRPRSDGDQLIFTGFYYEFMKSLFLFGRIVGTPFARSLVLVPMGAAHPNDRHGMIVGASSIESLFGSTCYLRFVGRQTRWRKFKEKLGEHDPAVLRKDFPDVIDFMLSRSNLTSSVTRMSG